LGTGTVAPRLREYRPFKEAREFARNLKFNSRKEWTEFTKSGKRPDDIPVAPNQVYEDEGWVGMGDWLGTGAVANYLRVYRPFSEAREFARNLKFSTETEWRKFAKSGKKPDDIPANPNRTYKDQGWAGMGDWLGTGNVATFLRVYRPFSEAREFARNLKFNSRKEWWKFVKSGTLPNDIPANPNQTYKDKGWDGMGDWLGTGYVASQMREYRSFKEAREFARSLNLKSQKEWFKFTKSGKLPNDIPANPNQTYKDKGWDGMGDWLGNGNVASHLREYQTFTKARQFARSLNLKSAREWRAFKKSGKLPDDIPSNPNIVYKDKGWIKWGDWLGTGTVATHLREYRTFTKARQFAQSLKLKSRTEWREFTKSGKLPNDIPASPDNTYKDKGWSGMGDWLGK
jgi:hypothetical protein